MLARAKSFLQGEDLEQEQDTDEPVKKRGGCGAQQPNITDDSMKMVAEFKTTKKKTDEQDQLPEPVERKQILSAERVFTLYRFCKSKILPRRFWRLLVKAVEELI